jgi:hypothetical protein
MMVRASAPELERDNIIPGSPDTLCGTRDVRNTHVTNLSLIRFSLQNFCTESPALIRHMALAVLAPEGDN